MRVGTKILALAAGVATATALAACAPSEDDAEADGGSESGGESGSGGGEATGDPVPVALITSTTGPLAAYGEAFVDGFEAGLDYATDGTGVAGGHEIEVEILDDAGVVDTALGHTRDVIGAGTQIITGTASSGIALALAEQAEQNQILYVSGPAAADPVTGINEYTFRSGRQSLQDVATAGQFTDVDGQTVVVLAQDNAFGQGNVAAVAAVLGEQGAEVVPVLVPEDVTEFTPFTTQIQGEEPNMVFVAWAGATSGAMWQSLSQQGVLESTTVVTGLGDVSTYNAFGDGSGEIDFLNHYFAGAGGNDIEAAMIEHVEAAGGTVDLFTPDGFTAAQMIVQAIEEGAADDVDAMVSALEGWEFEGPKGDYSIRPEDHALLQPMFHAHLVDQDGEWVPELVDTISAEDAAPPVAEGS
ncbi:substrate-binding domain-containing protein [Georgenia sp. Z1344]|uniref:substrate-binding domain-containing protein n=1 Tax=Georgenia sp. Z1344 TaxID=3416706 RepID=UPI003CED8B25